MLPGTPSVLFFLATLPLKPATIALKIGHLAFQVCKKGSGTVIRCSSQATTGSKHHLSPPWLFLASLALQTLEIEETHISYRFALFMYGDSYRRKPSRSSTDKTV